MNINFLLDISLGEYHNKDSPTISAGSGIVQKTLRDAISGDIQLDTSFMVQLCCGRGDCAAAGVPGQPGTCSMYQSANFGRSDLGELASSSGGGPQSLPITANGTVVDVRRLPLVRMLYQRTID